MALDLTEQLFIHYGGYHFVPDLFKPIANEMYMEKLAFDKPFGGLWATIYEPKVRDEWARFVRRELKESSRLDSSFRFTINPDAKIHVVTCGEDVFGLPGRFRFSHDNLNKDEKDFVNRYVSQYYNQYYIDFEQMVKDGYDGILVYMSSEIRRVLYSWDVTSLLVFNPDIVHEIE